MIVSIALVGASLCMIVGTFVLVLLAGSTGSSNAIGSSWIVALILVILAVICLLAAFVLFMLYLRVIADFLGESGTASEVMDILWRWVAAVIIFIPVSLVTWGLLYTVVRLLGPAGIPLAIAIVGIMYLCWVVFWIRQWIRLLYVIQGIRKTLKYEFRV
jgi:hypothetical protein